MPLGSTEFPIPPAVNPVEPADKAIQGLTAWDSMAHLVTAFGGGPPAVAAIGIIALACVVIVVAICLVGYYCIRSHHRTAVAIERIRARRVLTP